MVRCQNTEPPESETAFWFGIIWQQEPFLIVVNLHRNAVRKSQVFGLEDNASVIKMIYAILARSKLLALLAYGLPGSDPSDNTANEMSLDELKAKLLEEISQDPFMQEQASKMITWKELGDPEGTYASCTTPAQIQEIETTYLERVSHSKTAVAALKRSMKDMGTGFFFGLCVWWRGRQQLKPLTADKLIQLILIVNIIN